MRENIMFPPYLTMGDAAGREKYQARIVKMLLAKEAKRNDDQAGSSPGTGEQLVDGV